MPQWIDRERIAFVLGYVVLLALGWLVFQVFQPFLVALGWAGVLVVTFYPAHEWLEKRWGPVRASAASTTAVTLILIVPTLLLMTAFVREGVDAVRGLQDGLQSGQFPFIDRAWQWIQERAPEQGLPDPATMVREGGERVLAFLASKIGAVLKNVAVFLFDLVVVIFAMFYLFRDAPRIVELMRKILPFEPAYRDGMIEQARELIYASVTSSLIIAAVQGLLGGIVFAALGLKAPVFWGVVMAFFSLLPLVGSWLVWGPAAIWLFVTGDWIRGTILAAVGAGLVGTVDNLLRPYLISGKARLSGLVVFVAVLGGIGVFGMLGVILGPIVVATAASMLETYTKPEPKKPATETAAPRARPMLE